MDSTSTREGSRGRWCGSARRDDTPDLQVATKKIQAHHVDLTPTIDGSRWLLLIHQLPRDPAYLRVKIGRRLARVGAIALKNSVYVLPKSESTAEDFQWIRREIVDGGGEATVVEARLVEGLSDDEIEGKFRDAKDAEYAPLIAAAREIVVVRSGRRQRALKDDERANALVEVTRLERQAQECAATDFFGSSGRQVIAGILRDLRAKLESTGEAPAPRPRMPPIRGRTWVTRTGIHIDRIASAWLIRRFIDTDACFKFVPARGYVPQEGELRFDMFEAEFSHEGSDCTFETLVGRFDVAEPGVRSIAEVVHDIDIKDTKFGRPETAGIAACIAGLCRVTRDDEQRLAQGSSLFDALLAHFASSKEGRS